MKLINLDPIRRFNLVLEKFSKKEIATLCPLSNLSTSEIKAIFTKKKLTIELEHALYALDVFNDLFKSMTGFKRHIYLLGDNSIFDFANKKLHMNQSLKIMPKSYMLEVLSSLGLIYRFNVAKKFGYSSKKIMQLRLNGWGRFFCEKKMHFSKKYQRDLRIFWRPILEKHRNEYINLLNICDLTQRPLNVEQIHALNLNLPIDIVT